VAASAVIAWGLRHGAPAVVTASVIAIAVATWRSRRTIGQPETVMLWACWLALFAEAAVVGIPHEMKAQGIACFVTLEANRKPSAELKKELTLWVRKQIGALAQPDQIRFTEALPKTRSGKIMRRLLKEVAAGGEVKGDVTTLEDLGVLAKLKEKEEA